MSENVCKFCGAAIFGGDENIYQCGSWMRLSSVWVQSWMCQERCVTLRLQHEQTIETLQKRVAAAMEAAQQAIRFDVVSWRRGGIDAHPDSTGCYAWAGVLDDIAAILQGNSPEIPEGSEGST